MLYFISNVCIAYSRTIQGQHQSQNSTSQYRHRRRKSDSGELYNCLQRQRFCGGWGGIWHGVLWVFISSVGHGLANLSTGCSNSLPTAPALADEKCRMACVANTTEFCGGSGALMVYQDTAGQLCLSSTRAGDFNLEAVFVDAPETGPASVPLHVIMVNTIIKLSWSILSVSPYLSGPRSAQLNRNAPQTASGVFTSEELTAGGLLPKSTSQPQFRTTSLPLVSGGSPTFATSQFPPPAAAAYCVMNNPQLGPSGPQVLAGNSRSDLFALCPNTTANGRVDVVFDPVLNHPHYTKANCQSVYLAFVAV
jgi:hypothetical protein